MKPNLELLPYSNLVKEIVDDFSKYKKNFKLDKDKKLYNSIMFGKQLYNYKYELIDSYIKNLSSKHDSTLDNFVKLIGNNNYKETNVIEDIYNQIDKGKDNTEIYNYLLDSSLKYIKTNGKMEYQKYLAFTMPEAFAEKNKIEEKYKKMVNLAYDYINKSNDYISNNKAYNIANDLKQLTKDIEDFNKKYNLTDLFIQIGLTPNIIKNLEEIDKKTKTLYKPKLNIGDDFGFELPQKKINKPKLNIGNGVGYGVDNNQLEEDYKKVVEELKNKTTDYNTLSKSNKKLQDDYNMLSIAKNQLEYNNEEMKKLNIGLKLELDRLDKEFNDKIKEIYKLKDEQIEELKKKNKLAIGKESAFEIDNKKMDVKDIQTDAPTQINKDVQTNLPSLYITEFRKTYNQQGDYNKRVEAIQENANKRVDAIKNIYKQAKEDLIDEYNYLTNQLKEEYKNKKIRQNEYFEITSKEEPEDNNTTNKLVLTNNKVMADITPQMKLPPIDKRITPPQENNTPPPTEEKPAEEEDEEDDDFNELYISSTTENEEEEDKDEEDDDFNELDISSTTENEDDEEDKEDEDKVIPIDKVSSEISNVIDMFYKQDTPIDEAFVNFEKTIKTIPEEIYYAVEPYICKALANITVGDQKMFKDEEEVRQLIKNIRNKNKIRKIYKLPKPLEKAIKQSQQQQLTISPMLLRNRKQTNINKNIYQY